MEQGGRFRAKNLEEPSNEIEEYAKEVLDAMIREGVPPTPSNFDAYFDKRLDRKPPAFRKQILKLLEIEEGGDDEHQIALESAIKEAFGNVKKFLQHIGLVYKNLRHFENVIEKRRYEAKAVADKSALLSLLEATQRDIRTMTKIVSKESGALKEMYNDTGVLVAEVRERAIYDEKFGIFKKNYLLNKIRKEEALIKEFGHESTLMMVRTNTNILADVKSPKAQHLILRTVARLLMKTSRRSDVVAHYDNGIFAILMRHTSLQSAVRAAERLKELVGNTNFFIGDEEIVLDVDISIAQIDLDRSSEQTIVCALEALEDAKNTDDPCAICSQDQEV
ncbi:GGDEF domain-containing protein [Hydrogenimonas sp.]